VEYTLAHRGLNETILLHTSLSCEAEIMEGSLQAQSCGAASLLHVHTILQLSFVSEKERKAFKQLHVPLREEEEEKKRKRDLLKTVCL